MARNTITSTDLHMMAVSVMDQLCRTVPSLIEEVTARYEAGNTTYNYRHKVVIGRTVSNDPPILVITGRTPTELMAKLRATYDSLALVAKLAKEGTN